MVYSQIAFCDEFRDYQRRVLDSLAEKSEDNKLHIVAAPGSGKTILGLEIIRRYDSPCLILTPSISIREQWISRFIDKFVSPEAIGQWRDKISNDITNPGIITCITYQALFALYESDRYEEVINGLKARGYRCLCLDESHHLKNEWWKAIENTVTLLNNPMIIALTATPPYDSDNGEWERYNRLCGEIDCEVLTPEMVKKNTLCPYQDHVYISVPTQDEIKEYKTHLAHMQDRIKSLLKGKALYMLMRDYDAIISPHERAEIFIEEPRLLNALVAYIRDYGIESAIFYEKEKEKIDSVINNWSHELRNLAKHAGNEELEGELLEILLNVIIKKDSEHFEPDRLEVFRLEVSRLHMLRNNRISVHSNLDDIEGMARNSISRMDAIREIVTCEAKSQKDRLRMVILLDHIGREDIVRIETEDSLDKTNCVTVFESIRRMEHLNNLDQYMNSYISYVEELAGNNIGLLCGSFAILPDSTREYIGKKGKELGNTGYYYIDIGDRDRSEIVAKVTELLEKNMIRILIGTVSLLGEGWDAPCVNTVVIGSTISSFVQTNQMRGRGMRLYSNEPGKVCNIWHLVTLNPDMRIGNDANVINDDDYVIGKDYYNLIRRFDTVLGISNNGMAISSGIGRLGLPDSDVIDGNAVTFSRETIAEHNKATLTYASNRPLIASQWNGLMNYSGDFSRVRDITTIKTAKRFTWKKQNRYKVSEVRKIAHGLCDNMIMRGLIDSGSKVSIVSDYWNNKALVSLDNCRPKDSRLFLKYYEQMVGENIAPRYLLCKGFGLWKKYIPLPDYLKNKKEAEQLISKIGFDYSKLIFTRNQEGLRLLLQLRLRNISVDSNTINKVRTIVIK